MEQVAAGTELSPYDKKLFFVLLKDSLFKGPINFEAAICRVLVYERKTHLSGL